MQNCVTLSGIVTKTPILKVSPNGYTHLQFYLKHESMQFEAGYLRRCSCNLPVIVSRKKELTLNIEKGSKIEVIGFINLHLKNNNTKQLVLHASEIKLTN